MDLECGGGDCGARGRVLRQLRLLLRRRARRQSVQGGDARRGCDRLAAVPRRPAAAARPEVSVSSPIVTELRMLRPRQDDSFRIGVTSE